MGKVWIPLFIGLKMVRNLRVYGNLGPGMDPGTAGGDPDPCGDGAGP